MVGIGQVSLPVWMKDDVRIVAYQSVPVSVLHATSVGPISKRIGTHARECSHRVVTDRTDSVQKSMIPAGDISRFGTDARVVLVDSNLFRRIAIEIVQSGRNSQISVVAEIDVWKQVGLCPVERDSQRRWVEADSDGVVHISSRGRRRTVTTQDSGASMKARSSWIIHRFYPVRAHGARQTCAEEPVTFQKAARQQGARSARYGQERKDEHEDGQSHDKKEERGRGVHACGVRPCFRKGEGPESLERLRDGKTDGEKEGYLKRSGA